MSEKDVRISFRVPKERGEKIEDVADSMGLKKHT